MIKLLSLLGVFWLVALPAQAETLAQAIDAACATNPTLAAAGARQDALSETVDQARSGGRLAVSANAAGGYDRFDYGKGGNAAVSAELPIWTGGRVNSAVRAARGDVAAGEEGLRDTRAAVLEGVVAAYAALLYDQEAVTIAEADLGLLQHQIADAQARFKLGTSTLTDVARLQAQFADAQATLADAQAQVATDRANYRAIVGHDPDVLVMPSEALAGLPATVDQARSLALQNNPLYRQSQQVMQASSARIDAARANGAPSAAFSSAYGYSARFAGRGDRFYNQAASGGLMLHVPILTGGLIASQVRQARSNYRAAQFDGDTAGRKVVRSADAAWAALTSARAQASANAAGVAAADVALRGVRAEYAFALRSTLDILVADESLRAAQLALARNRSDVLIAQAALLRAIGGLDREAFAVPVNETPVAGRSG